MIGLDTLAGLLGSRPAQSQIHALLEQAHVDEAANTGSDPEIKAYPDVVYHNYRSAGISLQCKCFRFISQAHRGVMD